MYQEMAGGAKNRRRSSSSAEKGSKDDRDKNSCHLNIMTKTTTESNGNDHEDPPKPKKVTHIIFDMDGLLLGK